MRFASAFLLCLAFTGALSAQSYKTAVGLRFDKGINISAQQYLFNNWTAEGIIHTSLRSDDVGVTLLGEKHHKILFRNLNIYYGAGPHYYWTNGTPSEEGLSSNVFGLSFIGGAEISLGRINIAVDLKPELHLSGDDNSSAFEWNGAAISARYILFKRERKTIKDWKVWDRFGGKEEKKKKKNGWF